ncbi:MAG: exonuclease [Thaumarchaeota archaeon]|nr:exonuclease [Nitrososphaerota archaeon]
MQINYTKNGVCCKTKNLSINLDPKHLIPKSINFISHAHKDHLPTVINNDGIILTSIETTKIASLYGIDMKNFTNSLNGFSLIDTGHVIGSKGLLFNDTFYTGDICIRDERITKNNQIPECKTLITECTFGLPEFAFPKLSEIVRNVNKLISRLYSKGIPVLLLGHAFGKAQILTKLFSHWTPIYYQHKVKQINDLCIKLGMDLKSGISDMEAEKCGLLYKKPWIMIAPFFSEKNQFVARMKSKFGAVTIGFTGWANSKRFYFGRQHDYSFSLSDHCDFNELVDLVHRTKAEKVYTIHGFTKEFSNHLNKIGIDSEPLHK